MTALPAMMMGTGAIPTNAAPIEGQSILAGLEGNLADAAPLLQTIMGGLGGGSVPQAPAAPSVNIRGGAGSANLPQLPGAPQLQQIPGAVASSGLSIRR